MSLEKRLRMPQNADFRPPKREDEARTCFLVIEIGCPVPCEQRARGVAWPWKSQVKDHIVGVDLVQERMPVFLVLCP